MALPFHLVFLLCLTSGLLISGTWSANIEPRARRCPRGWEAYGNQCYKAFGENKQWLGAEHICRRIGGHLASIHNQRENDLARELLHQKYGRDVEGWIGLNDRETEGRWEWSHGWGDRDPTNVYRAWRSGEPNNYGGGEDCVSIRHPSGPGWNDEDCNKHLPYVCARDR